jgi:integrase/recombinase XerD
MKINRFGKAEILTPQEITLLFSEGFVKPRDRALFGICLFTGCRVSEALALKKTDINLEPSLSENVQIV